MSKLLKEFNVNESSIQYEEKDYLAFKDKELLDTFRLKILENLSDNGFGIERVRDEVIQMEIDNVTYGYDLDVQERNYLFHLIDGEINGYGPLTELLKDNNVTEIMVNSPSDIYIEIDGNVVKDNSVSFVNDEHIIRTIERLISYEGKVIDVSNPIIDARMEDGSRINAIIPPIINHPVITIRKFSKNITTMDDLVGNGTLTPYMARFLEASVLSRLNILVSGSSLGGETTLLNILSSYIDSNERIIAIEKVNELNLSQDNVLYLHSRDGNYDGGCEVSIGDLINTSTKMRPDRIIVGEVSGEEAFSLLQVMNAGFDGSMTSIHANNAMDAINRLETMLLMNGNVTIGAAKNYISNSIDLVVHISKMKDGRRKVTSISEVVGIKDNEIKLHEIFNYVSDGILANGILKGKFKLFDSKPRVLSKMDSAGIDLVKDMFK